MKQAIASLKSEHRSISAVLQGLKELARMAQDARVRPGVQALRSMVRYIDEYPEKLHHPKEDEHLFARLVARAPDTRLLVEELRAEHQEGAENSGHWRTSSSAGLSGPYFFGSLISPASSCLITSFRAWISSDFSTRDFANESASLYGPPLGL